MRLMSGGESPNPLEVARETIALFREMSGGEKQATLQEKLSEMQALRELAKDITGGNDAGRARSESNFWDAAAGLLANKAFGEGFGKALGATMESFAANKGAAAAGPRVVSLGPTQAPQNPHQQIQQPRPAGNLPPTPTQAQGAPQQPQQAQQPTIEIPDDFPALVEKIETATDDRQRIEAVVNALYALRPLEQWREFVHGLLGATAKNEKDAALRGLHGWLKVLVGNRLMAGPTGNKVMETFVTNWDAIHATVAGMMSSMMPQSDAPQAPAAPAAATPQQESDEGEGEGEQGPDGPMDVDLPPDMHADAPAGEW
jgi:hypothetical protein